ncbi:MAG: hypothetical protein A49_14190 [Methyloceanibacter sp.]|nr:MAG: hypothetical protein A49_14190 [Methyloceanibacter sp.]
MGKVVHLKTDGLRSLIGGLGDPTRDKAASGYYAPTFLNDFQLLNAYRDSWIARKLVDIPAQDALRKWRSWVADQDKIEALEAVEKRLGLHAKLLTCKSWARLWGGAAIYIGTDQPPEEPFDPATIKKDGLKYLTVFSRRELMAGDLEQDPFSEHYGRPAHYEVISSGAFARIHPSRLVIQVGVPHADPWNVQGPNMGWGDSALQSAYDAARNADGTAKNIASLVFEANVDVVNVPDLMGQLANPDYEKRLTDRFTLAAANKSINKTLILDSAETYDRKQVTFQQLPEVMQQFLLMVSGAADIPITRFLGQSPAGMSATGESDMKNYHDKIQSVQELELEPAMYRLDEALIRSTFGVRPDDIGYDWAPLEQMNEKEISEIGERIAKTAETLTRTGLFMPEELRGPTSNMLAEAGVMPGLDKIVDETDARGDFDLGTDDPDEDVDQETADARPRTLYVSREVKNAADIIAWAKKQGFTKTTPAADMHVTIAYSREAVDWMKVGEPWDSEIKIGPGGPRLVEKFDGGAVVLLFKSRDLEWRHESIRSAGASWDYEDYQPHITITRELGDLDLDTVEPYQGEIVLGPELFEEVDTDWAAGVREA